jgi:hypothetical protein
VAYNKTTTEKREKKKEEFFCGGQELARSLLTGARLRALYKKIMK